MPCTIDIETAMHSRANGCAKSPHVQRKHSAQACMQINVHLLHAAAPRSLRAVHQPSPEKLTKVAEKLLQPALKLVRCQLCYQQSASITCRNCQCHTEHDRRYGHGARPIFAGGTGGSRAGEQSCPNMGKRRRGTLISTQSIFVLQNVEFYA